MFKNKFKAGPFALGAKLGPKILSIIAKLLKGLKFAKVGLAAVTFAGYSVLYSWKFALLLMVAVGFHESGHVWAMKRMGIPTKGFYFLPFVGGAAIAEEQYKTYGQNSYVSIMGPVWGAFLAWVCGTIYWITGVPLWAAAAAWMATLNLFNLLPITPLDGGQLMRTIAFSIHRKVGVWFLLISLVLSICVFVKLHIGLFVLITVIGAVDLFIETMGRRSKENEYLRHKSYIDKINVRELGSFQWEYDADPNSSYPKDMNKEKIIYTAFSYVGTITILLVLLFLTKNVDGADMAANFLQ